MTPAVPAVRYRVGRVMIDPGQRILVMNGEQQHVRDRVFRLLMYLVENRNRVVSKPELVERVWDGAALSESVLYKTILELRRLVEENPDEPVIIKTVPKAGYQFRGLVEEEAAPLPVRIAWTDPALQSPWSLRRSASVAVFLVILTGLGLWMRRGSVKPLPESEVSWWRLDEAAGLSIRDSVGNNSGRLVAGLNGAVPRWSRGLMGNGLAFDGGDGYAEGPFPDAGSPTSVCLWLKLRAARDKENETPILDCPKGTLLIGTNGLLMAKLPGIGIGVRISVIDDRWHHVALVDEGSYTRTVRLFVDGVEQSRGVRDETPVVERRWRLGRFLSGRFGAAGMMDDLRVYGRPLRTLELEGLYRCGKDRPDIVIGGRGYYYLPMYQSGAIVESDGTIRNPELDYSGVQFSASGQGGCSVTALRGADLGQDLRVEADVLVPRDNNSRITHAGPYLRSRAAYPGDGLAGGTSSGYWVKASSTGEVSVWQLNPYHIIATAPAPAAFDAASFHRLRAEARGRTLRAWIDGEPVKFEAVGYTSEAVQIENTPAGHGTAGIAFGSEANRGLAGGQRARVVSVEALR